MGNAGMYFQTELLQLRGNQCSGARFAIAELRMLVDIAPPCGDLREFALYQLGGVSGNGQSQRGQ